RFAQVAIDEELSRRQIVAEFAGDDCKLTRTDYNIVDDGALPPYGTIEMPSGTRHHFLDTNFAVAGKMAGIGILVVPGEDQGTFVPQEQALPLGKKEAVDRPVEGEIQQPADNQQ